MRRRAIIGHEHSQQKRRLLDDLIGEREHVWRNREVEMFGCIEIDDQLILGWFLGG